MDLEHIQRLMIYIKPFPYKPNDSEREKASNGYIMSLLAVAAGLPFPIFNLVATFIFYLGNKNGTYFVRWHTTQTLLSQVVLFLFNTVGFWWSLYVFYFEALTLSKWYIVYMLFIFLINFIEFIVTVYTAIQVRKGIHIEWHWYNQLTYKFCKPEQEDHFINHQ